MMTSQKNSSQASSVSQEEFQLLEEQHLEQVLGGTGGVDHHLPKLTIREVKPEIEGTNYGTYIPPTDPETHQYLRLAHIDPNNIPENHSYTFTLDGKNIIKHIRPGYTVEDKK